MSDKEFITMIKASKDVREILQIMVDNEDYLTHDPYYRDFRVAMIDTAKKLLEEEE